MVDRLFNFIETYATPVILATVVAGGIMMAVPGIKEALKAALGDWLPV